MAEQKKTTKKSGTKARNTTKAQDKAAPVTNAAPEQEVTAPVTENVTASKTFTEDEVQRLINAAVAKALTDNAKPTVITMANDTERVQFLWQAPVADENVYEIANGLYGRIVGKTGAFSVPKNELSRAMDSAFRLFLERRWIIYVSGLSDEEAALYGVNYKPGEILDRGAFAHLADMGDEIIEMYPKLCKGHRDIVQKVIYEAFSTDNRSVTRDRVMALKNAAKKMGDDDSAFNKIIEIMNEADAS